jgi:hypothetical protein
MGRNVASEAIAEGGAERFDIVVLGGRRSGGGDGGDCAERPAEGESGFAGLLGVHFRGARLEPHTCGMDRGEERFSRGQSFAGFSGHDAS